MEHLHPSHQKCSPYPRDLRSDRQVMAASLLLFDDLWSQVEVRATNGGGPGTHRTPDTPAAGSRRYPEMRRGAQLVFQKMGELIGDILTVVDVDMFG